MLLTISDYLLVSEVSFSIDYMYHGFRHTGSRKGRVIRLQLQLILGMLHSYIIVTLYHRNILLSVNIALFDLTDVTILHDMIILECKFNSF